MISLDLAWSLVNWAVLVFCILGAIYLWGIWNQNHFKKRNIPYLKPTPFFGNMRPAICSKNREQFPFYISRVYNELKDYPYGGIFNFKQPIILLRDPELIKTVMVKDFDHFTDHWTISNEAIDPVLGRSLFTLKGQRWKDMRSVLSPAFTSSKMKTMFIMIEECCQQVLQFLEQCQQELPEQGCDIQKDGEMLIVELKDLYTRFTNDVIATTAFGISVDSFKNPRNEFYTTGQKIFQFGAFGSFRFFGYLIAPKLMQMMGVNVLPAKYTSFFRSLIHDTVTARERDSIVRPDMLQLLMQAKKESLQDEKASENDKDNEKHQELTDDDIAAQAMVFFVAGFDTTSTLLCFASHQLAVHPEIQTRLQEEIDQTLQEYKGKFTYDAIQNMKYLDMVVSETLRLFPPATNGDRVCVKPYTLDADPPLELQSGDTLFIPIFGLHRDPNYYPEPERFDPERFSEDNKHNINPSTYLPFGAGPRSCIGNRFALMAGKLALVQLLSGYNLKVIAKSPVPVKIVDTGFSMSAEGGFWFGLESRRS